MPVTLLVAPGSEPLDHAVVSGVVRLARRLGDVALLTGVGALPSDDPLRDDLATVAEHLPASPRADSVVGAVADFARADPHLAYVLVLRADAVADAWPQAAVLAYRSLPTRPYTVLVFENGLPASSRAVVRGRLAGTVHRAVAIVEPGAPARRFVVTAERPPADADPVTFEEFCAAITGTPPFYTNPLTPLTFLGRRIAGKLRREVIRRRLRPAARDDLVRIGSDYGGWWVPAPAVRAGAVAYCAGAGEDITFDLALHERGVTVRTLDPTPRAIAYVTEVGPESDRFRFVPVGLWSRTDVLKFFAPSDGTSVSHSAVNLGGTDEYFDAPVRALPEVMADVGDSRIDILKLDIEGAEYEVVDSLLADGPLPAVLLIEFDQPVPLQKVSHAVARLRAAGYELNRIEGWNFTFTRPA